VTILHPPVQVGGAHTHFLCQQAMVVYWLPSSYSLRFWIMVQRVQIAGSVLVGNFLKIHFQAFPSSLYTRKRCSSISSQGTFFLALRRYCSSLPRHPSSSLLASGSPSLRLSSSLISAVFRLYVTARPALPCQSRVRTVSLLGVWPLACRGRVSVGPGES
jgi:hypothetical protein